MRSYGWSSDSQHLFIIANYAGFSSLWRVNQADGRRMKMNIEPYTWITQLSVCMGDKLAFLASASHIPDRVVLWDGSDFKTIARSSGENLTPLAYASPQPVDWQSQDGTTVHGIFYPPCNPDYVAEGLPPAIVHVHGGPTSQAVADYSAERAYFTSRGYAWMEVNYRGSSGYGRSYQHAQRLRWGDVDVEDAVGAARALVQKGLVNDRQLVIHGGSAGGFTVLNTLIHYPGVFKAGICRYGVSNLFALDMDTHKFEAHYTASLVGKLPDAARQYHEWSPVFHAEKIKDAVAIFQGSEDKVVPPQQSEQIVEKLRQQKTPHIYQVYQGEGHGFRKQETIADYLKQMERFIQEHVLFAP
jgi:dipeptidyl aminopeptidase/acylaminoacyl peptidase